jgi:hypothetical protein
MSIKQEDPHHCKCFVIDKELIPTFRKKLESLGFKDTVLQLPQGQLFGLIITNGDDKQMHVRVLPTGQLEAEIEPSHDYPFAHLNPKHSYSAHPELEQILRKMMITYHRKRIIPFSCIRRIIIEPNNPTHVATLALALVFGLVAGVITYYLTKEDKTEKA